MITSRKHSLLVLSSKKHPAPFKSRHLFMALALGTTVLLISGHSAQAQMDTGGGMEDVADQIRKGSGGSSAPSATPLSNFLNSCSLNSANAQAIATDRNNLRDAVSRISDKDKNCQTAVAQFQQIEQRVLGTNTSDTLKATRDAQALKQSITAWQSQIDEIDQKLKDSPPGDQVELLQQRREALQARIQDAEKDLIDNQIEFASATPARRDEVVSQLGDVAAKLSALQLACPNSPQVGIAATQIASGVAQAFGGIGPIVAAGIDALSKLFSAIVSGYQNRQTQGIRDTLDEATYPSEIICAMERMTGQYCNLKAQLTSSKLPDSPCQLSPQVKNLVDVVKAAGVLDQFGAGETTPSDERSGRGSTPPAPRTRGSNGAAAQLGRMNELSTYLNQLMTNADDLLQTPPTPATRELLNSLASLREKTKTNLAALNQSSPSLSAVPNAAEDAKDLIDTMTQLMKVLTPKTSSTADALVIKTIVDLTDKTNLDFKSDLSKSYLTAFSFQLDRYLSGAKAAEPTVLQSAIFSCEKNIEALSGILGRREGFLGWKAPEFANKISKFLASNQSEASQAMGRSMCGASLGLFNSSQDANNVPSEVVNACKDVRFGADKKIKYGDLAKLPFKDRACYAIDLTLTR